MIYSFCPKCGGRLEDRYLSQEGRNRLVCASCGFIFYQNAKPTASSIIERGGKILLGQRAAEPSKGMWDVIGGFLEPDEHPEVGAKREASEETGLEVEVVSLLGIFMDTYFNFYTLNICYIVRIVSGIEQPGDDIAKLKWFDADSLPEDIAFKNGKDMINAWLEKNGKPKKFD